MAGAVNEYYYVYYRESFLTLGEITNEDLIDGVKYEKAVNSYDEL